MRPAPLALSSGILIAPAPPSHPAPVPVAVNDTASIYAAACATALNRARPPFARFRADPNREVTFSIASGVVGCRGGRFRASLNNSVSRFLAPLAYSSRCVARDCSRLVVSACRTIAVTLLNWLNEGHLGGVLDSRLPARRLLEGRSC